MQRKPLGYQQAFLNAKLAQSLMRHMITNEGLGPQQVQMARDRRTLLRAPTGAIQH